MLKQLLATAGVNVSLHIPYVPDISPVTDISTSSTSNMPPPPTFKELLGICYLYSRSLGSIGMLLNRSIKSLSRSENVFGSISGSIRYYSYTVSSTKS